MHESVDKQLRRQLGQILCVLIQHEPLADLEEFIGVHRSRLSRLRGGKLTEFSIPWLLRAISSCGYDFTLNVSPRERAKITPSLPKVTVVRLDAFGRTVE